LEWLVHYLAVLRWRILRRFQFRVRIANVGQVGGSRTGADYFA
jgi:hypothetical protein